MFSKSLSACGYFRSATSKNKFLTRLLCSDLTEKPVDNRPIRQELYFENRVVRLIFNKPKNRNVLSLEMMNALYTELHSIDQIEKLRAVILAGDGPAFCAGHDLKELIHEQGSDCHKQVFKRCSELMLLIQSMKLPVIAEVDGVAAAAGCQLISTCDIVVASEKSTFSVPGLKAGIFCSTPGIPLARNIPRKLAMDMLLTARTISAKEALQAGLVSRVVSSEQTSEEALRVAEDILKMSRSVTALGKAFFYAQIEQSNLSSVYRQGESVMCGNLKLVDAQQGIQSFVAKSKEVPSWTHSNEIHK
uniref:Enoyl-CoA hydratase domain-containing protein 3, mitochondrial n=1 Tax=Ditylenchus dipsaci TaxID=166011 RepID=A0A915E031_9BILA